MPPRSSTLWLATAFTAAALACAGCASHPPPRPLQADVIVVGAGIAGLAAALQAADGGARVVVVDSNSVGGGHAMLASGFSLVGTPLQQKLGYHDDVERAVRDILAWGGDADPYWVRRYVEDSRHEVYDWLVDRGVEFAMILPNPEDSVPRFHLPRGAAARAVLPMLRGALGSPQIAFLWNHEVTGVLRGAAGITGVTVRDSRSGHQLRVDAPAVVIATGGFESNDALVREHWPGDRAVPEPLYVGSGQFATGSGLQLAVGAGATLERMDRQLVYVTGMPNPRDPAHRRGLLVLNPAAIMVDAQGRRFVNEAAPSKDIESLLLSRPQASHWLVFDEGSRAQLMIRGGPWLDRKAMEADIMANPALVSRADDIAALAVAAGLPPDALAATLDRYNGFVSAGRDADFQRFGQGTAGPPPPALKVPPFYAIKLSPMTRKSMGGIAIDHDAHALGAGGQPVRGLYAAGEATGVAGINGSHGGSGTFLGPSLLLGRIAGRTAAAEAVPLRRPDVGGAVDLPLRAPADRDPVPPEALGPRLAQEQPGFWHFTQVHRLVMERQQACASCHDATWPPGPAVTREQQLTQLASCTRCH
ncbi:MAG: FAD-binding protein [Gammaproteobacteria bacterium]|nr:FAD-binding protein [Gammaproteobacteria bacterium]